MLLTAPLLLLLLLPLLLLPELSTTQCKCHVVGTGALLHRASFSSSRPPFHGQGHDRRRLSLPTPTPFAQQRGARQSNPPCQVRLRDLLLLLLLLLPLLLLLLLLSPAIHVARKGYVLLGISD